MLTVPVVTISMATPTLNKAALTNVVSKLIALFMASGIHEKKIGEEKKTMDTQITRTGVIAFAAVPSCFGVTLNRTQWSYDKYGNNQDNDLAYEFHNHGTNELHLRPAI